jgi:hypothetical protein
MFEKRVAEAEPGGVVAFMAGGGGAGKSSAEQLLRERLAPAHTILDGTLSTFEKARRNVSMALDNGQGVVIAYVYREPVDALRNGVLTRAMSKGRTVTLDAAIKGHAGSSTVVRKLQEEFGDNPNFRIYAVDNSGGAGEAQLVPLESITPVIIDGLKERFINATEEEFQAGRISEAVYKATLGRQADTGAGPQAQAQDGADRQGREAGVQGRGGSVQEGNAVELEALFKDLQDARGLKLVRANERAAEHPMAAAIEYVNANFYDILEKLDDAGSIKINCK